MRKLTLILVFVFCSISIAFAQMGTIKGKVIDKDTEEPVYGASVYVKSGGNMIGCATDPDGYFTIKPLDPGVYTLYINHASYDSTKKVLEVPVDPDKITFMDDVFMKSGRTLVQVDIFGYKLIDPEETGRKTIDSKTIESLAVSNDISLILATLDPNITLDDDGKSLHFRGSRSDAGTFWVDGVRMRDSNVNLPSGSIGSMTVYSGGIPAKYGDCTGGVVIIQTKGYFDWLAEQQR